MNDIDVLSPSLDTLMIEVTSKCNLRCAYCSKSDAVYESIPGNNLDMTDEKIADLYKFCKKEGIKNVSLSGVGETAMTDGWHKRIAVFLDDPEIWTHLVSNFARILSDEDIEALLKLNNLQVSFDSANIETVKKMRSKADLRTITFNLIRLLKRRRELKYGPHILVNCTLCKMNIGGLEELASFCVELGVDRLMISEVMTLTETNAKMPETLDALSEDEVILLAEQLYKVENVLRHSNTGLDVSARLRFRLGDLVERLHEGKSLVNPASHFHRSIVTSGCRQPWIQPFVRSDLSVYPCCIVGDPKQAVGNLTESSMEELVNNAKMRSFREKMLSESGNEFCANCTLASERSWEEFAFDIKEWKGVATAKVAEQGQVKQVSWPELRCNVKPHVVIENVEMINSPTAIALTETKHFGLHRLLADVDISGGAAIRFDVTPEGRRRLRFDIADSKNVMLGRVLVVLVSRPTVSVTLGGCRCNVTRGQGGAYHIEIFPDLATRIGHFNISLMRDDNSIQYKGDGRSGLVIENFEVTGGRPNKETERLRNLKSLYANIFYGGNRLQAPAEQAND